MKTEKERFDHTVSILVKAYLNDELAHKICSACAVGNIVADALGTRPRYLSSVESVEFDNNYFANGDSATAWYSAMKNQGICLEGIRQINMTGYTRNQLQDIEYAFEEAPGKPDMTRGLMRGACTDPTWMFNGLMAVVDVLASIHNINLSEKEEAKSLFVKDGE